jgi:hypothetical protein
MQKDLTIVICSEGGKISTKADPHHKSGYENYRKGGRCQYYDKALRKRHHDLHNTPERHVSQYEPTIDKYFSGPLLYRKFLRIQYKLALSTNLGLHS